MKQQNRLAVFSLLISSFFLCSAVFGIDFGNGTNAVISTNMTSPLLRVGYDTSGNTLTINSNATVSIASAVTVGGTQIATNNRLLVSSGSALTIGTVTNSGISATNGILMGNNSTLSVGNGSSVQADCLYTGITSNDSVSTIILNSNATVTIAQDAQIGSVGSGSSVFINGGAIMIVSNTVTVGTSDNSNNVINVNNGGIFSVAADTSIVVNNSSDPSMVVSNRNGFNINSGGTLQISGDANFDRVVSNGVTMNAGSIFEVGGTLTDEDNSIDGGITYRLDDSISTNVAGWNINPGGAVYIGTSTDSNRLVIAGGTIQSMGERVVVGSESNASFNVLTVSGTNSQLNTITNIWIGNDGDNNRMNVLEGAAVIVGGSLDIGVSSLAAGNRVFVSDSNSTLTVSNAISIGVAGSGNGLTVSSNGVVYARSNLVVGVYGDNNELSVLANGTVQVDGSLIVGQNGNTNRVVIRGAEGSNAVLTVQQDLTVGDQGTGNSFTVNRHSDVSVSGNVVIGVSTGGNSIVVSGTNASFNVAGALTVGNAGVNNRLTVSDQGQVSVSNLYLGSTAGSSNNTVLITGQNSRLSVSNDIYLGTAGSSNNTMNVQDGGTLFLGGAVHADGTNNLLNVNNNGTLEVLEWDFTTASTNIIFNNGSTLGVGGTFADTTNAVDLGNFTLAIDGGISTATNAGWITTNTLLVGNSSDYNKLSALDGGTVSAENIIVGAVTNSDNNTLLASGTNALICVMNDLTVGQSGSVGNLFEVKQSGSASVGNNLILGNASANNTVRIGDTGSTNVYGESRLTVSSNLYVGYNGGSGNNFNLYSNGYVSVSNDVVIGQESRNNRLLLDATNAVLDVAGNLTVGNDRSDQNSLRIYSGTVNALSDLIVGSSSNSLNNELYLRGSNSLLNVSGDLTVGDYGDWNRAIITTGATVNVTENVYVGRHGENNRIEINGSNSLLNVYQDLFIGQSDQGGNKVSVFNGGLLNVSSNLSLAGVNSVLQIDSLSSVTVSNNYSQGASSVLEVGVNTNQASLIVGGTADFSSGAGILLNTAGYGGTVGQSNQIYAMVVQASALMVNGVDATTYNLSDLDFELASIFTNSLKEFNAYITNNMIVVDNFTELAITETYGLTGSAGVAGDEIDRFYNASNTLAAAQRDILDALSVEKARIAMLGYYGEKESANPIHTVVNDAIGNVAAHLSGRQSDVRSRMGLASGEAGASAAPAAVSNQYRNLQGWMTGFGSQGSKSSDGAFYGYDSSLFGTLIGFDLMVNDNVLVGAAGGYSTASVDKDNGASADASTRQGALYTTVAGESWFFDSSLVCGLSSIDQDLGNVFDTTASYDAQNVALYVGVGHETVGQYLVITPQAGLLANYYRQDGYTEESDNSIAREVSGYDALYLQSLLGCSIGLYMTVGEVTVRPDFRVRWLHEFNADEEDVDCNLIGSTVPMVMTMQSREADVLQFGAGFAVKLSEALECRMDLDLNTFGGGTRYDIGGKLIYQF